MRRHHRTNYILIVIPSQTTDYVPYIFICIYEHSRQIKSPPTHSLSESGVQSGRRVALGTYCAIVRGQSGAVIRTLPPKTLQPLALCGDKSIKLMLACSTGYIAVTYRYIIIIHQLPLLACSDVVSPIVLFQAYARDCDNYMLGRSTQ